MYLLVNALHSLAVVFDSPSGEEAACMSLDAHTRLVTPEYIIYRKTTTEYVNMLQ